MFTVVATHFTQFSPTGRESFYLLTTESKKDAYLFFIRETERRSERTGIDAVLSFFAGHPGALFVDGYSAVSVQVYFTPLD